MVASSIAANEAGTDASRRCLGAMLQVRSELERRPPASVAARRAARDRRALASAGARDSAAAAVRVARARARAGRCWLRERRCPSRRRQPPAPRGASAIATSGRDPVGRRVVGAARRRPRSARPPSGAGARDARPSRGRGRGPPPGPARSVPFCERDDEKSIARPARRSGSSSAWIVDRRALARSTSTPWRARLVERHAAALERRVHRRRLALTSEERVRAPRRRVRVPSAGTGAVAVVVPGAIERVGLASPSRMRAGVRLVLERGDSARTFVASPRQSGRSPLANGSSVPRCPTFARPSRGFERADHARRRDALRLVDEEDAGHSLVLVVASRAPTQQLVHAARGVRRRVVLEAQRRRDAEAERPPDRSRAGTASPARARCSDRRARPRVGRAVRKKTRALAQVRRHPDARRDGHAAGADPSPRAGGAPPAPPARRCSTRSRR